MGPDVVMACASNVLTLEALAAVTLLSGSVPDIRGRVVSDVDLMALQRQCERPQSLDDDAFGAMFTRDAPVVSAFHGDAGLIHRRTSRRKHHDKLHVPGCQQAGATTTAFDMGVLAGMNLRASAPKGARAAMHSMELAP